MGKLSPAQQASLDEIKASPERPEPGSKDESYDDVIGSVLKSVHPPSKATGDESVEDLLASGAWPIKRHKRGTTNK